MGATGFIGSHIAEHFVEQGETIVCLVRPNADTTFLQTLNVELIDGDITDIESLDRATLGCNFIIHTAALTRDWGHKMEFQKCNIDGTMNVLKIAKKHEINRLIVTGSISSYGEEHSLNIKEERSPYNSHYNYFLDSIFPCRMNLYRDSKAQSTQEAMEYAQKESIDLMVLEPVWVYGEREFHSCFYQYLKTAQESFAILPGSKQNKFHLIYVRELARAFYLAYKKDIKGVERLIIGDDKAVLMNDFYQQFCRAAEVKKPLNIPKAIIYPLAFVMELVATLLKIKNAPLLTRGRVNMFYDNIEYNTQKAKLLIDFEPKTSQQEAIEMTVNWYKSNGYL